MIYRSNFTSPDLTPHFKYLHSRVMGHSFGHDVPSDWVDKADDDPAFGIYKRCGMWTHDECAILHNVAKLVQPGRCLDIGCHTGWTTAHIAAAHPMPLPHPQNLSCSVGEEGCNMLTGALEHHYIDFVDSEGRRFRDRFFENCGWPGQPGWMTSREWFGFLDGLHNYAGFGRAYLKQPYPNYVLVVIDGDHEPGMPLEDARNAAAHLAPTGVIMLHDGVGKPVREAVQWLMASGFKCRAYFTPHLVFCCWRGAFVPPDHVPDPEVKRQLLDGRFSDFDFARCE